MKLLLAVLLALVLPAGAQAMLPRVDDDPLTGAAGTRIAVSLAPPKLALTGKPAPIVVNIVERSGNASGLVTVMLATGPTIVDISTVVVPAGGTTVLRRAPTFGAAGTYPLVVTVADAATGEAKDAKTVSLPVADFAVDPGNVLVPSFAGFGAQMNQHLYAQISQAAGVPPQPTEVEDAVVGLQPQFVRLFVNQSAFTMPDRMDSFVRTMLLAQRAGATINVTWQGGAFTDDTAQRLTDLLVDLVRNRGVTGLRWVTIQNEVNSTNITPAQNEAMYRSLDARLRAAGLRDHIHFMGGDLVQTNQRAWFQYMAEHMSDLLDAYSIHVFWDYWDTAKLQQRLLDVRTIVDSLPAGGRKPVYVTEYGVRGQRVWAGATVTAPGVFSDGTPMRKTNVNAFQHLWFDVLATKLGFRGTVKWDSYYSKYDNGTQAFYMINGPDEAWSRNPVYWSTRFLTRSVLPDWRVVAVQGAVGTKVLSAFSGPGGGWTVLGLDAAGASSNGISPTVAPYAVGGLPPLSSAHLLVWNDTGDGSIVDGGAVQVDGAGIAHLAIPLHAGFALTTLP
jgi:hypothetical protein